MTNAHANPPLAAARTARLRLLQPSMADLLIGMAVLRHYYLLPGGWEKLVADANIGLQVRAGDLIRATGSLPGTDPFTFTHPGRTWFAWEWLFDILASGAHQWWGVSGLAVIGLAFIATAFAFSYLTAVRRAGQWPVPAVLLLLGVGASSIHFLARPHLVTWLFLAVSVAVVEGERRAPSRRLWLLVPLALLWANLHGGFLILPVYLGLVAAGLLFERRGESWVRFAICSAAALAATVCNPYGVGVHRHIVEFMRSGWVVQTVQEFLPPSPSLGFAYWFHCAIVSGSIAATCWLVRYRRWADAFVLAFFAFSACRSARHIPLMVLASLPPLAGVLSAWLRPAGSPRGLFRILRDLEADMGPQFARVSLVLPGLLLATLLAPARFGFGAGFPPGQFPVAMTERHLDRMTAERTFTTDAWGDYLVYRGSPSLRVWVTGNNDYLGPEIGREYLAVLDGRPEAEAVLERWAFRLALVPAGQGMDAWFGRQPGWRKVDSDRVATLYERRAP